jgi:hypothetical protein
MTNDWGSEPVEDLIEVGLVSVMSGPKSEPILRTEHLHALGIESFRYAENIDVDI